MVTILGGLAEFERALIRARTGEGLKRARERGIRSGPKNKLTHHQQREALARREAGESCVEIGRSYAVSNSMISRLKQKDRRLQFSTAASGILIAESVVWSAPTSLPL